MPTLHYNYDYVPTVRDFAKSDAFVRGLMGPFGCVHPDTKVITEAGPVRIADIAQPVRVLSWNAAANRFQLAQATSAFPKGTDYLYRVATRQGEFVAAGHHRVLCADGTYRPVADLSHGDVLAASAAPMRTLSEVARSVSSADARHWKQRLAGFLGSCAGSVRRYGQRLREDAGIVLATTPQRAGVRPQPRLLADYRAPGHSRLSRWFVRHSRHDSGLRAERQHQVAADSVAFSPCGHSVEYIPAPPPSRWMSALGYLLRLFAPGTLSTSKRTIISVTRTQRQHEYWDLQVLNTNNYVTEDGAIHHNSGKSSGCVVELFRRSMSQKPSADGIRRTRWAVIRNVYRQLEDTTIRTFKDWFPVDEWGRWREKDFTYQFTAIPNLECEILFRALDRPEQVSNLLSMELTGAWVNEAREVPRAIIDALQGRVGRYPPRKDGGCTWSGIMMDTNPPDDDSWWYEVFEEQRPDNHAIFKQPSGLAPNAENRENLPKNYYENLAQGKKPQFKKVYVDGQYGSVQDGKAIYGEDWNDQLHISDKELDPNTQLLIGMDFGLTPAAVIGQQGITGSVHVAHELVSQDIGARRFVRTALKPFLAENFPRTRFTLVGDPSGNNRSEGDEKSAFQIIREEGIFIEGASTNNAVTRWDAVRWFLTQLNDGEPAFTLHPRCKFLRKGFNGGYRLRRIQVAGDERYESKADKNKYSHPHDGLQCLCLRAKNLAFEYDGQPGHMPSYEPEPIPVY